MRKRRNSEDDSSLELLLDTMCNTFGGVMFIAIMLFVIISNLVQTQVKDPVPSPEELYRQIESLRVLLNDLQLQLAIKSEELKKLKTTSTDSRWQEILLLEKSLQQKEISLQTINTQLAAEKLRSNLVNRQTKIIEDKQLKQQIKANELNLQITRTQQQLLELRTQPDFSRQLTFKLIKPGSEAPFFLILFQDSVYPVGPWQYDDRPDAPDSAVESVRSTPNIVECRIRPGAGCQVLQGDKLSREFQELMQKIPKNRIPKFYIYPNSAPTAFRLREILKKANIRHGCTLAISNDEPFRYQYAQKVNYEY